MLLLGTVSILLTQNHIFTGVFVLCDHTFIEFSVFLSLCPLQAPYFLLVHTIGPALCYNGKKE